MMASRVPLWSERHFSSVWFVRILLCGRWFIR